MPSGTMSNQIAVKTHTQPGDELICEANCHIYNYEAGGPAVLSGVIVSHGGRRLWHPGRQPAGRQDSAAQRSSGADTLVCLENTHNRCGGRIKPLEKIQAIRAWTHANRSDSASRRRCLWNAVVATGIAAKTWAAEFDSVSVCFSKGLGRTGGSALAGPRISLQKRGACANCSAAVCGKPAFWRRRRVCSEHHLDRLAEDHRNAQTIARAIAETPDLELSPPEVETNIIWIEVDPTLGLAKSFAATLKEHGVLVNSVGSHLLRAVTHLDVSAADAERAADVLRRVAQERSTAERLSSPYSLA